MGFNGEEIEGMTESEAEAYIEAWREMNAPPEPQKMKVRRKINPPGRGD